jgi:hypothetical protein
MRSAGLILALLAASTVAGVGYAMTRGRTRYAPQPTPPTPRPPSPPQAMRGRGSGVLPSAPHGERATLSPSMSATLPDGKTPTLESWRTYYQIYGNDIPTAAAMAWTSEESGGNVCAIGSVPQPGQTMPQEYGLSQLNAQDPSNLKIATPQVLRAMCRNRGTTRADWQTVERPLTEAERIEHAVASIDHMRQCREHARALVGAWPGMSGVLGEMSPDFWRYCKLYHASPALYHAAPEMIAKLGRPPATFAEFQTYADAYGVAQQIGKYHQPGGTRGYLDEVWLNVARVGAALENAGRVA